MSPDAIVHAGDIGDLGVLDLFRDVAPVLAVRGNIDEHAPDLPDVLTLDIVPGDPSGSDVSLRILLMHIAVNGPRLRVDAARLARAKDAALVVCGHSHVPLIARDRDLAIFNPGSCGPKRFHLPIVFGRIDVSASGVRMSHVDCATGETWTPR